MAGAPLLVAAFCGFVVSAVCGYHLHDRWTFRTNTGTRGELVRWLALPGSVLALNVALLWQCTLGSGRGAVESSRMKTGPCRDPRGHPEPRATGSVSPRVTDVADHGGLDLSFRPCTTWLEA